MKPNLPALRRMSELAKQHGVQMQRWIVDEAVPYTLSTSPAPADCGTIGCLCGTYATYECRELFCSEVHIHVYKTRIHLGLSNNQFGWLFLDSYSVMRHNEEGEYIRVMSDIRNLSTVTTEEAVRRLDRFIAYHEKQQQMYERLVTVRQIENQDNILSLAQAI